MKVAKSLAVVAARFMSDETFAKEVTEAFKKLEKEVGEPMEVCGTDLTDIAILWIQDA